MKNRFWKQSVLAMVFGVALTTAAFAEAAEEETAAVAQEEASEELSDNLFDFQIKIDDKLYQFPMSYADFTAAGWEIDEKYNDPEEVLKPNSYMSVYFTMGDSRISTDVFNLTINNQKLIDCLVGGVDIDNYDWKDNDVKIELAKGIAKGVSGVEDIKAAYGNPTDTYESDLYTKLTYEKEIYSDINFYVYQETGTLDEIDMRNLVEPEGFDAGSASEEVPEEITAYEAPTELGDDLLAYNVEFDGALYQLPCPVSALLENGWTIDKDYTDEHISAHSTGWVYFIKGGNTFHVLARNAADYATIPENCWVENLDAGDYGMEVALNVAGGIGIGSTEEELKAVLDATGKEYDVDDSSSMYSTYQFGEDYWNSYTFYIYTDEEGSNHNLGEIYKIEVEHEK